MSQCPPTGPIPRYAARIPRPRTAGPPIATASGPAAGVRPPTDQATSAKGTARAKSITSSTRLRATTRTERPPEGAASAGQKGQTATVKNATAARNAAGAASAVNQKGRTSMRGATRSAGARNTSSQRHQANGRRTREGFRRTGAGPSLGRGAVAGRSAIGQLRRRLLSGAERRPIASFGMSM